MNALANREVSRYLDKHFVATYLKVGTFRIANGQKQGGNVAAYFCLPDGRVLHTIAGVVNAETMLRETRWAVDLHKLAVFDSGGDDDLLRDRVQVAHQERLQALANGWARHDEQSLKVHDLLAKQPLTRVQSIYRQVFEDILAERVSNLPVEEN